MSVGLLSDVDGRPVRDNVRSLQQSSRIEFARFPIRTKALGFGVVLIRVQKHEEILGHGFLAVIFIGELVNRRLVVMDVNTFLSSSNLFAHLRTELSLAARTRARSRTARKRRDVAFSPQCVIPPQSSLGIEDRRQRNCPFLHKNGAMGRRSVLSFLTMRLMSATVASVEDESKQPWHKFIL